MASSNAREEGYEDNLVAIKVDQNFHCAVCWKILKDPVMCPRNQHLFCTGCITEHLNHSQTCPTCKDELTLETLMPAPRFLTTYLSELDIRCDYHARGCPEFVQVGMLKTHVASCGFSPVVCRNEGCTVEINKRDRIHHETEVCELRKVQCHECTEIRKEINEMKENLSKVRENQSSIRSVEEHILNEVRESLTDTEGNIRNLKERINEVKECLNKDIAEKKDEIHKHMCGMQEEILKRVETMMTEMKQKMANVDKTEVDKQSCQDIFVAGGRGSDGRPLTSVEMFSSSEKRWVTLPPMKTARYGASSFVYKDQLFLAGGRTPQGGTDTIVTMTMNQEPYQWHEFPARLPAKLEGHKCVVYNDRMFVVGGYTIDERKDSDDICEVLLVPPYSTNILCRMPQPRMCHGVELYDNRILIIGGRRNCDRIYSIAEYDINQNEYRELAKLPIAMYGMATVRWGSHVITMGGFKQKCKVPNTVVIYNTEKKECHMLPSMKHNRARGAAVVSGNSVVVMGGVNEIGTCLKAAECFTLDRYTWEDLPEMTEARDWHTAVVKPGNLN